MRKLKNGPAILAVAGMFAVLTARSQASVILESEPNNSIATAQNVDGGFSLDFSANIGDTTGANTSTTIPHVTITATGDGTFDYYSFTVPSAGAIGIFDIDFGNGSGGSLDTELGLYSAGGGSALAEDDDFSSIAGAGGSVSSLDSFIQHTFTSAGTFVIGVGEFNTLQSVGGLTGNVPDLGDTYTLQISIEGASTAPAAVPEPSSLVLLGIGAVCLVGYRRKRRRAIAAGRGSDQV